MCARWWTEPWPTDAPAIILSLEAGVAQSVEQLIRNEKVGCSIHLSGTNTDKGLLLRK